MQQRPHNGAAAPWGQISKRRACLLLLMRCVGLQQPRHPLTRLPSVACSAANDSCSVASCVLH